MTLWGSNGASTNTTAGVPKFTAQVLAKGSGKAARVTNTAAIANNSTPNAYINTEAVGVFALTTVKHANTSSESSAKGRIATGWNLRRAYQGPVLTLNANGGANFANGETVLLSNGTSNGTANLTTNATGNLVSATVRPGQGGLFTNAGVVAVTFMREKHLSTITVTGGSGYSNTDTIRASNGVVNGSATIVTDGSGVFVNGGITLTNVGIWGNTQTNTQVVFTVLAANGAASNGSGATLVANLSTSTTGTCNVATMGGRAGRVHYECLVAFGNNLVDASSNTVL